MHIPILPRQHWPSSRGKKLLASPTIPLESASRGDPFRRFVRSLSLRPSWLLAPCADPTKMVQCPPQPPRAFTSGLPVPRVAPRELPDMTTVPHGNLHRRDFHPQVQQLASLRFLHWVPRGQFPSFIGTIKALRLPVARPAALRFLRLAVPRVHSLLSLPGGRVRRRGLELVTRYLLPGFSEETTGSPKFLGNPNCPFAHVQSTPAGLLAPDHCGAATWPLVCEQQRLPRKGFRSSIAWLSDWLSTLRRAGYPATTQDSLPAAGQALPDGLSPAGFLRKVSKLLPYISSSFPKLSWRKGATSVCKHAATRAHSA